MCLGARGLSCNAATKPEKSLSIWRVFRSFRLFSKAEHVRHLVAVTVSEGISVGLLLNGQLVMAPTRWPAIRACRRRHKRTVVFVRQARLLERYASTSAAIRYYTESLATGVRPMRVHVSRS